MSGIPPGETFAYFLKEDTSTEALPLPIQADDRLPVVRGDVPDEVTYYASPFDLYIPPYAYATPTSGQTLTADAGIGAYRLNPAGVLATLNIVLPPNPRDGQVFAVSTTQTITAVTPSTSDGSTVSGTPLTITISASWWYRLDDTTWRRAS